MVFSAIPQVITEDRASSAQFIDGSLKFNSSSSQYLKRSLTGDGNRKLWTWSGWLKQTPGTIQDIFSAGQESTNDGRYSRFRIQNDSLNLRQWVEPGPTLDASLISTRVFRDPSAFFHCVMIYDVDNSTTADKVRWYINGQRVTSFSATDYPAVNSWINNSTKTHTIGGHYDGGGSNADSFWNGHMSQVYFIDGLALGPGYFGYTDPLTNTWRPKKFRAEGTTVNDGTVWSDLISAGGYVSNCGPTKAFDGSIDSSDQTDGCKPTDDGTATLTLGKTIHGKIRVYFHRSGSGNVDSDIVVNGIGVGADISSTGWHELPVDSLRTLSWKHRSGIVGYSLQAIEVDGVVMQDSTTTNLAFGTNGFYLPLDGNTPIGKDQSGNGNDWTPVNFGGSVELPKATGALPILNTNEAGTVAKRGVRTDSKTYTVTASGGNYYLDGSLKPTLNAYRGSSLTFDYTGASGHPLYLSSLSDGKHNSKAYSVSFDGTGDALRVADHADLRFGTGAFTIECYVWFNSFDDPYPSIISKYTGGTASWIMRVRNLGYTARAIFYTAVNGGTNNESTSAPIAVNRWHHIAMVREGTGSNQAKMYVDGTLVVTTTDNTDYTDTQEVTIGAQNASDSNVLNGYMSNVRIIKGTALYTSEFTPPQTTLTNVTGTTLLCCQESNAATAAVIPSGSITVAGNPAATQAKQPFLYDNNHGNYGLNTATSNTTKITIPHWAADTLYYYCNAHSGMGSSINVTTDIFKADPFAWKCVLAMPLVGVNDESKNINCTQSAAKTIANNNAAASNASSNFYGGSFYFDGTEDYLQCGNSSDYDMDGDFTAEAWVYPTSHANDYASIFGFSYDSEGKGWNLLVRSSTGRLHINVDMNYTDVTNSLVLNKWTHLALVRSGKGSGNCKLYIDGVADPTTITDSDTTQTPSGAQCLIGSYPGYANSREFTGYIQDARIYKGVAKYTSNFVVPSTSPDVLPDTPSGVSGGSKLAKITDGAVSFDGTGDYLNVPWSSDFELGTGDFTIEYYGYWNTSGTSIAWGQTIDERFDLGSLSAGSVRFFCRSSASTFINISSDIAPSKWSHIAAVREGTAFRLYIDGKLGASGTASDTMPNDSSRGVDIGRRRYSTSDSTYTNGFISNVRIVKGTALYTSNFTPPSAPLTDVTNTKLLTCQSTSFYAAVAPLVSGVNNGTVWSSSLTGDSLFRSGFPAADAFNGTTKSSTNDCTATPQVAGQGFTFTFGGGVPFTTLQMQCDDNNGATVTANGVDITSQLPTGSLTNTTITGVTSPLTSLSVVSHNGDAGYLGSITIDGVMLKDPITPNGDAAATNFNPFTDDINTIRGQETGYATLNPLSTAVAILTNGNLMYEGGSGQHTVGSTLSVSSGKWYWESFVEPGGNYFYCGIADVSTSYTGNWCGSNSGWSVSVNSAGNICYNNAENLGNIGINIGGGQTWGWALDMDAGTFKVYVDGIIRYSGNSIIPGATSLSGRTVTPATGHNDGRDLTYNFGQKPFKFPPPDGFQSLNAANVRPETVIARPDQFVGVSLHTGNGGTQSISSLAFQPDLIWCKTRSNAVDHKLVDSVRGLTNILESNQARDYSTDTNGITATSSTGFALGNSGDFNSNGRTYVSWSWKAGGNKNTFNVDDVGYASASDVGMNVGGQNSNAYDQTRTWSNSVAADGGSTFASNQGPTKMFNGVAGMGVEKTELTTNGSATFTSPVQLSGNLRMFIACGSRGSSATGTFDLKLDGVSVFDNSTFPNNAGAWVDFGTKTWTTLQFGSASGGDWLGISAIEVAGKSLVDNGVSVTNVPSYVNTGASVGTKQGFSIVKWTHSNGTAGTIAHGLSKPPTFVIYKSIDNDMRWTVGHTSVPWTQALVLDSQGTPLSADGAYWSNTAPNSGAFTIGDTGQIGNGAAIAYCWHDVPGLQKFGKYEGNNNADGPFVELGFRPAIIWMKNIDSTQSWAIYDNKRDTFNGATKVLLADTSAGGNNNDAFSGSYPVDFLSSGFKIRGVTGEINSSHTFIYCAWAEAPAFNLYGAQSNAR